MGGTGRIERASSSRGSGWRFCTINFGRDECLRTPFEGIGKPEPLKRLGAWSRRLTDTDRVVYVVRDTEVDFLQARFHYDD